MLYGTRKELNKKLKRMFGNEERYALLVWTKEDVMAQVENMTEHEAHIVLELIGQTGTGDHAEEGVSFRTVQDLYAGIQESTRRISVPADMLAKLTNIAGRALSEEDARAWPLVCLQYPTVADALADIDWLRLQLAA
ncbi:TPA: DUF1380 domain-containing protein [Klebsiella michiganensis]|jgi:Zn-dependent alcohol dehydrogenase|uniref:DUF1380 domain-containing protein n=3 Tax=Klebsiella/Raoultella group TaxID=2890311 RepID=A0A285B8B8_9ENTR|nr:MULTISPECIES: DUF1380 family protein [Klebsiella/Raoultella group]EKZ2529204.1 DUF1380 family protein [Citrobacter farmeri]MDU7688601.1 DUF1380 family protein [Bacillota bacterium]EKW3531248.1 DUF1380 family protein [Raoultella planticola]MBA4429655.1 DUF1380 family protein [Klebsiella michiganensis]MCE9800625.1 DUF1380 domain-containing protein [Raoultella ornithinolytica]